MALEYSRLCFSSSGREGKSNRTRNVSVNALCFPSQFLSQERLERLYWNFAWFLTTPRGIFKQIVNFVQYLFSKWWLLNYTFREFSWNSQNISHMNIPFISIKAAYNGIKKSILYVISKFKFERLRFWYWKRCQNIGITAKGYLFLHQNLRSPILLTW